MPEKRLLAKGICERIGGNSFMRYETVDGHGFCQQLALTDHDAALRAILQTLVGIEIHAIGHRVVHGGPNHAASKLVDARLIDEIDALGSLAPQHNPPNAACIRICLSVFGESIPQVVAFDTAYHRTMPPYAKIYPIPYEYYETHQIQRYGFHGLSHMYINRRCSELIGREHCKIISCHIGNGCSITAIENGRSIDTTLGYTSLDGLMMGTRSGAIDPAIVLELQKLHSGQDISEILYHKSGLLGISGVSNDWRDVSAAAKQGNARAALAIEMQRYQIAKYVGAYLAAMGGVDAIAITGGIGANDPELWEYLCSHLEFAGVEPDKPTIISATQELRVTSPNSKIAVYVIPTDEERIIAEETYSVLQNSKSSPTL